MIATGRAVPAPSSAQAPSVQAAWRCRCPRCGRGALYRGFLTVRDRCDACGLDLSRHDSGDGPAVILIFLLGTLVVPLALLTEGLFAPPYWLHILFWPPVILGMAIGLLRPLKAFFVGQQYRHRSTAASDDDG
ncbi:MAG: DUF983 domain-containing protein [Alphaproteobacteria bacterium]